MYPKWNAKFSFARFIRKDLLRPIFVWRNGRKLSEHTQVTYQIYGVAELHAEKFHALSMKFLREFAARFDAVTTVRRKAKYDSEANERLQARLELQRTILAEKHTFSFFSHGVRDDILDTIGRDVKTWGEHESVWDGMHLQLFPREFLPDSPTEALESWNEYRPQPAFEIMTEFCEFTRDCGLPYRFDIMCITKFCINVAFPHGSSDADERAFEEWLASVFSELDINAEWYVTGTRPESAGAFFDWEDAKGW